ncbi:MAG: ABC transporter substrate-binding protein [Candidatus Brocadiaceae bacterium]|nr:ABC transporter substrate-binding protein [Candidatus Brocadiaceae bacterium]
MRKISYILLFLLLPFQIAVAGVETEAEKTLKEAVGQVFSILAKKDVSMDQKKREVIEITNTAFSFPLMAKLSIGKENWSQFNAKQKVEFTGLFTELFQKFYIDKLDLFSDEEIVFQPATVVKNNKVQVPTTLLSKGKKFSVLYKMANTKMGWQIYDITIEGVSLIHTYRSQYQYILEGGKVEDLLAKMREKKRK